jgi:PHO85 cyclin-1
MSTRRHPASLLPIAAHDPQFLRLIRERVTYDMVLFVAQQTARCVRLDDDNYAQHSAGSLPTPPPTPIKENPRDGSSEHTGLPTLHEFISHVINKSGVQLPVLLTTTLFLERLRVKLPKVTKG